MKTLRTKQRCLSATNNPASKPLSFGFACFLAILLPTQISLVEAKSLAISSTKITSTTGDEFQFTISSDSNATYCGLHIEYGGTNEPSTNVRMNFEGITFPYTFRKAFTSPGVVQIRAYGARVMSALGCAGEARLAVTVITPPAPNLSASDKTSESRVAALVAQANRGDLDAAYGLANLLAVSGADQDAVKWFTHAARGDHVKAMNSLGYMIEEGRGTLQNHALAADWYQKAMMQGNPDAMVNRGILFAKGMGVTASRAQAYIHFSLAAAYAREKSLRDEAVKLRDEQAKELSREQLSSAQSEAKKLADRIK